MTEYRKQYEKNRLSVSIKLNKNTEADMVRFLAGIENKQSFIKDLIRKEMKK